MLSSTTQSKAEENENQLSISESKNCTIKEGEEFTKQYLMKYFPSKRIGDNGFLTFVSNLLENEPQSLRKHSKYEAIYTYLSTYRREMAKEECTEEKFSPIMMKIQNQTIQEILNENKEKEQQIEFQKQMIPYVGIYGNLVYSKGKAYAEKWWNKRNSAYHTFTRDCTNFVSQILVASGGTMTVPKGWELSPNGKKNTKYWYHKKSIFGFKYNQSFTVVDEMYKYWAIVHETFTTKDWKVKVTNYAKPGDIIQYRDKAGDWYHSGWVYSVTKNKELYATMHTGEYLKRPLSESFKSCSAIRIIRTYMR